MKSIDIVRSGRAGGLAAAVLTALLCFAGQASLLLLAGCGGSEKEFMFLVRDDGDDPVEGIEIRLAGQQTALATTNRSGSATVNVSKPGSGNLRFSFSQPEGAATRFTFDEVYEVTPAAFEEGMMTVHVRSAEATSSLDVTSTPAGATVLIDGVERGTTPTMLEDLAPGEHEVLVKLAGYHPYSMTMWLRSGATELRAPLTSLGQTEASLRVSSTPAGATITLDGRATGLQTPTQLSGLEPGQHTIRFELAEYLPYEKEFEVRPGGPTGAVSGKLQRREQERVSTEPVREPVTRPPASSGFKKEYVVTVLPGAAEVYVDGGSQDLFYNGPFKITLAEGTHRFQLRNTSVPVDVELTYEVEPGDRNRRLFLNWETGAVTGK